MIAFNILCEYLTDNQRYSWFIITPQLYNYLTDEEKALVRIERLHDGYIRCFYPANKGLLKKDIIKAINKALLDDNIDEVVRLKQQLKEIHD